MAGTRDLRVIHASHHQETKGKLGRGEPRRKRRVPPAGAVSLPTMHC